MKNIHKKESDSIIKKIFDGSLSLGKNHKQMSGDLNDVFQVTGRDGVRVQYKINELGEKEIVKVFTKENHKNTTDY